MLGQLEAIVFDWGDTLVHFPGLTTDERTHLACVRELYEELLADRLGDCFSRANLDWGRFRAAYQATCADQLAATRATFREHRLEDRLALTLRAGGCSCEHGADELAATVDAFVRHLLAHSRPVEGAAEVLAQLSERYPLGLVSNYPFAPLVIQSLERFGLRDYLTVVLISGAVGWVKPHGKLFRQVLAELGVEPAAALFVGDDLANDMRGAKAAGLHTAWLTPTPWSKPDPAVDLYLTQLVDLFEHLPPPGARSRAHGCSST